MYIRWQLARRSALLRWVLVHRFKCSTVRSNVTWKHWTIYCHNLKLRVTPRHAYTYTPRLKQFAFRQFQTRIFFLKSKQNERKSFSKARRFYSWGDESAVRLLTAEECCGAITLEQRWPCCGLSGTSVLESEFRLYGVYSQLKFGLTSNCARPSATELLCNSGSVSVASISTGWWWEIHSIFESKTDIT